MRMTWKLAVASIKMFFRQREAIIWTLLLPLFMVGLFSLVNFEGSAEVHAGFIEGHSSQLTTLRETLQNVEGVDVSDGSHEGELQALARGERDIVLEVIHSQESDGAEKMMAYVRSPSSASGEVALYVVRGALGVIDGGKHTGASGGALTVEPVPGTSHSYIDFLLPGIISMSIMQLGIFGVAFSLVSYKKRGILRRLSVTPVHPGNFVIAQIAMRLVVAILQIGLLSTVGAVFLNFHLSGSIPEMIVTGLLGALVFLGFGFAIAGISKSEDQVAPLANIVAMPMILLSGVFFSRSNLPGIVRSATEFLPLTFLTDTMREIAVNGATLNDVLPGLGGLAVWCLLSTAIAIKLFRWE